MDTKLRVWIGIMATAVLMGCAAPVPVEPNAPTVEATPTVTVAPAATPEPVVVAPEPTATPRPQILAPSSVISKPFGETSVLERVASADVIVRAEVESVSQVVDSFSIIGVDGQPKTPVFAKGLAYRFDVNEYLKGSGGNQVVGVVLDRAKTYSTKADADADTTDYLAARDTQWEDREAILFLANWRNGMPVSTKQSDRYALGAIRGGSSLEDLYTIASKYSKRWLPLATATTSGQQTETERTYMLDVNDGTTATTTITLTKIKAEVAKIAAEVAAGDGTAAYARCVYEKYAELRRNDNRVSYLARRDIVTATPRFGIGSGVAKGTRVNPDTINWLSSTSGALEGDQGDQADLFEVDPVGVVKTLRPLPAGEYRWVYLEQYDSLKLCNAPIPESAKQRSDYIVDVTAPASTVHEAFFDPVTVGTAVKADSTNGTLSPSSFGTTTIESISYESSTVKATFAPADSPTDLQGGSLAFIEEDGTTLTLAVGDSTSSGGTLTWSVTTAPWADGDKLMLRITAPPALTGLDLSDISLPFVFGTTSYAVTVPYNLTDTTVTATLNPTATGYVVKLGGEIDADGSVFLETIGANTITVEVAGPNGAVAMTYTVTVTREQFDYANPPIGLSVIRVNHNTVAVVYVHNQGARYHNYHSRSVGTEWLDEYTSNKPRDFLSINTSASCGMSEYRARSKASLTDAWGEWSRIFTYRRTERC